jgi:hypothetical protein
MSQKVGTVRISSPGSGAARSSDQFGPANPPAAVKPAAPLDIFRNRRRERTGIGELSFVVEAKVQRRVNRPLLARYFLLRDREFEKVPPSRLLRLPSESF